MKLLIAIPSKNRVETLSNNTWGWAKDITKYDVKIFVEPQDYEQYKVFGENNLVILNENNQGLGYAKRFIQDYANENSYELIFKLDDDTKSFTNFRKRCPVNEVGKLIETILSEIEVVFEQSPALGAVAFPYRFHLFKTEKWTPVKKVQSSYVVRTELLCPPYKFSVFEDFAVALNALVKGFKVLRYNLTGQDNGVAVGEGTGGLQDFDRSQLAEVEAEQLRKMYPPLTFRKVEKPWKIEPDIKSIKL